MYLVGIFFILFCVAIFLDEKRKAKVREENKKDRFERTFAKLTDFKPDYYYLPEGIPIPSLNKQKFKFGTAIGYDVKRKEICFFGSEDKAHVYKQSQIIECEIDTDKVTSSKQSTSSTVGRAVVGGVLTGGVGAVIGGATGKRTSSDVIKNIDLKIIVDDPMNPLFRVTFFTGSAKKGSHEKCSFEEAEKWRALVSGLIRNNK